MKRTLSALLLILLLLTGCGASSSNSAGDTNNAGGMAAPNAPQENVSYGKGSGWADDAVITEEAKEIVTGSNVSGAALPSQSKMIYTADLTLQTKDFDTAASSLAALVSELGGYFENRELRQGGTYRSLYCVVRVPAENFAPFLDRAGDVAHMVYRNETSDNVSEAYYDLEARLTTQRTKLQRLQELLSKAENMEDIITIESAISDTELQIEYLTGSLRSYDSLIGYSTINISLDEVYRLSTEQETPVTFGDRLATAFKRGLEQGVENLEDFIIYVARNWLSLIFCGALIVLAVVFVRRLRSKRRQELTGSAGGFPKKGESKESGGTDGK